MNKFKIKLLVVLNCFFIGSTNANSDILSQNIRDYRTSVDEVIIQFVNTGKAPTIDQALRIQSCENDMLALARLEPSIADSLPALLLANYAKLQDLRHLPGELILGRAKTAGLDILSSRFKENEIEYKKGNIFRRNKRFVVPVASEKFPSRGDWIAHHAYAKHCVGKGEYQEAGEHFQKAIVIDEAKDGTKTFVWEFENIISSAWAYFLAGDLQKAKDAVVQSSEYSVHAPPSKRALYLKAVLCSEMDPQLGMLLNHTLVQR